jgi:hypothetical protein
MPTAVADTIAITKPQSMDFHQRAVPRPMERMGKCSPRQMITRSVTALNQISASFRIAEANVISGTKKTKTWRITTIAKSEMNSPAHVAREAFVGTDNWLGVSAEGAPRFSVSIDSIKMPQGTVWIQEISRPLRNAENSRQSPGAYWTVTKVPTGISEKNLRAASSGNRMQPCDAGRFGTYPACIPKSRQLSRMKYGISTW